jgi:ABC-type lipoprotein export system ATPase subunit
VSATIAADGPRVRASSVMHIYRTPDLEVVALRGVDLEVGGGETVALLGPSGSGKSTLLGMLAGLIRPSAGVVEVAGQDLTKLTERGLLAFRRAHVGILLQNPSRNLLPYATVRENVQFARRGGGAAGHTSRRRRVHDLLEAVGLADKAGNRASRLSGGEQQRLALAVSLANDPAVLLADEPTSQLDHDTADHIAGLLRDTRDRLGTTVVVVTHDEELATSFDRAITMRDGRVGAEGRLGQSYAVVGRDGSVQLPGHLSDRFPPGTLVEVQPTPYGVELRPRTTGSGTGHTSEGP